MLFSEYLKRCLRNLNLKTSFPEVLETIVQELGLYSLYDGEKHSSHITSAYKKTIVPTPKADINKCTEERPYSFEIQPFDEGLLNYWAHYGCLLYTSPSPRDMRRSRMPSSA